MLAGASKSSSKAIISFSTMKEEEEEEEEISFSSFLAGIKGKKKQQSTSGDEW
jgi:hypothetical protein